MRSIGPAYTVDLGGGGGATQLYVRLFRRWTVLLCRGAVTITWTTFSAALGVRSPMTIVFTAAIR